MCWNYIFEVWFEFNLFFEGPWWSQWNIFREMNVEFVALLKVDVYSDRPTAVQQLLSANKFLHSSPIKGQIFIEVNIMYGQSSWVWYITQNEGFIKALMKDAFTAGCLPSLWRSGERRRLTLTSPQAHKLLLKRAHTWWVHLWASLYTHTFFIFFISIHSYT